MRRCRVRVPAPGSTFAGFRFPPEVITVAVRWYLRYGLSYRDVEELLAERGIEVDHVTVFRWVQRFTPLLIDAARSCRHVPGDRWFADETYVKVAGRWVYLYRAIDQYGQVIDVLVSEKRDLAATRRFFTRALDHGIHPSAVTTDKAPAYPRCSTSWCPLLAISLSSTATTSSKPIMVDSRPGCGRCAALTASFYPSDLRRTRFYSERAPGPLRTRLGIRPETSAHNGLHRTHPRHLMVTR
jgi:transposase-like protein